MTIGDNFSQAWMLTKDAFGLIKTDKSLVWPPLLMLCFQLILPIAILLIAFTAMNGKAVTGVLAVLLIIIYIFMSFFVNAFFGAVLSWMVYQTKSTGSTTLFSGIWRATKNLFDVIIFGIVSFLIAQAVSAMKRRRRGVFGLIIGGLFAGIAKEAWDLVGNLTLPSMIITENSFFQAIKESQHAIKYLPESLVGIFVFDMIAGYLYFLSFLGGLVIGLIVYLISQNILLTILLGIAVMLIIVSFIGIVKYYVKASYFTLLYMQIQASMKGKPEYKEFSFRELKKGIVSLKKKIM
jgi:hypothetical protein